VKVEPAPAVNAALVTIVRMLARLAAAEDVGNEGRPK